MVREVAISIYLALFRLIFTICKMFPQKEKTVCVSSFGDNIHYSTQSLRSISDQDIIYLKDRSCTYPFDTSIGTFIPFTMMHPIAYIRSIYHLATATTILTDNYFGFFAAAPFKSGTLCIQLWHAVGALKQFGLNDPAIAKRSDKAIERFRQVYDTFDYVIVGSEKMGTIFRENFGLSHERLRRAGIPRTDLFYDENAMNRMRQDMIDRYPETRGKKVILYAPTFRRNGSQTNALDTGSSIRLSGMITSCSSSNNRLSKSASKLNIRTLYMTYRIIMILTICFLLQMFSYPIIHRCRLNSLCFIDQSYSSLMILKRMMKNRVLHMHLTNRCLARWF